MMKTEGKSMKIGFSSFASLANPFLLSATPDSINLICKAIAARTASSGSWVGSVGSINNLGQENEARKSLSQMCARGMN